MDVTIFEGESAVRHRTVLTFSVATTLAIASLFFGLTAVATPQPLLDPANGHPHFDNGKAISHPSAGIDEVEKQLGEIDGDADRRGDQDAGDEIGPQPLGKARPQRHGRGRRRGLGVHRHGAILGPRRPRRNAQSVSFYDRKKPLSAAAVSSGFSSGR